MNTANIQKTSGLKQIFPLLANENVNKRKLWQELQLFLQWHT